MNVTFWGVRGSIACPGKRYAQVGGNTSCVEVEAGGTTVVLDAGTGLRELGASLTKRRVERCHLLLSHTHWDHTCGLPFFRPAFDATHAMQIVAGHLSDREGGIRTVLATQMSSPSFPVSLDAFGAALTFLDVASGASFELAEGLVVHTARLAHPDGATGYRIEHGGVALAYVTDTEHEPGRPDPHVLSLIADADLVIYDCTYTDLEFEARCGWGHSTWQEGVRLCRLAGARRLAIFHHDPDHDDAFMRSVSADAKTAWPGAFVAREGHRVRLSR